MASVVNNVIILTLMSLAVVSDMIHTSPTQPSTTQEKRHRIRARILSVLLARNYGIGENTVQKIKGLGNG